MVPCGVLAANRAPLRKSILGESDGILNVRRNDVPCQVVIRAMPIGLKLSESGLRIDEYGFYRRGVLLVFRRKWRVAHLFVVEHPREARPLVFKVPMFDEILYQ